MHWHAKILESKINVAFIQILSVRTDSKEEFL